MAFGANPLFQSFARCIVKHWIWRSNRLSYNRWIFHRTTVFTYYLPWLMKLTNSSPDCSTGRKWKVSTAVNARFNYFTSYESKFCGNHLGRNRRVCECPWQKLYSTIRFARSKYFEMSCWSITTGETNILHRVPYTYQGPQILQFLNENASQSHNYVKKKWRPYNYPN